MERNIEYLENEVKYQKSQRKWWRDRYLKLENEANVLQEKVTKLEGEKENDTNK